VNDDRQADNNDIRRREMVSETTSEQTYFERGWDAGNAGEPQVVPADIVTAGDDAEGDWYEGYETGSDAREKQAS